MYDYYICILMEYPAIKFQFGYIANLKSHSYNPMIITMTLRHITRIKIKVYIFTNFFIVFSSSVYTLMK